MKTSARHWLTALCLAAPLTAPAAPPAANTASSDAPMTIAARQAWRAGLRDGRKAHQAKDYAGAIQGFDRALAAFPDDPRALSERGWARFQAGDLPARGRGRRPPRPGAHHRTQLRASALYNLGRI
ncbi:MAG: hypothetical protein R3F43_12000 [bacterium]